MAGPNVVYPSLLSTHTRMDNFVPIASAKITTGGTSTSADFSAFVTSGQTTTFKITNKGTFGAFIAVGHGSATAVASGTTAAINCDYVGAGAIITQDYPAVAAGPINFIAAIEGSDTVDASSTILEITIGYGQ